MSDPADPTPPRPVPWWRRRWVTIGEVVGVGALLIAGLGYWDSHRQRTEDARRVAAQETREAARAALVLTAEANADGSRLTLSTLAPGQAIQEQRYLFPRTVLSHAMEVNAARPQIDRAWFADGLKRALDATMGPKTGEGTLPVAIVTRYIEAGETRSDVSIYRVGYAVRKEGLFGGRSVTLLGLALLRKGVTGDAQVLVDGAWGAEAGRGLAPEAR
jgi:hypothetical protein